MSQFIDYCTRMDRFSTFLAKNQDPPTDMTFLIEESARNFSAFIPPVGQNLIAGNTLL